MQHWSNYWTSSKTLNSFAESDTSKGYTGEIKKHWFEVFSSLNPRSRIVDIGCGNGALASLAVEYSDTHGMDFEVHGIDAAAINPIETFKDDKDLSAKLSKITFHSKTPAEQLPFKANSVDCFVSQFGFEYSDIPKSLIQCKKALSDNGFIHILAHHPESTISLDTNIGAQILKDILQNTPLFIQVDLLLDIATQVFQSGQFHTWNSNSYNQSISRTLKWILDIIKEQYKAEKYTPWLNDTISRVVKILQNISGTNPQLLRQHLAHEFNILDQHRIRLEEQINATLNETSLNTALEQSAHLKLKSDYSIFKIDNQPFAWSIQFK